MHDHAEMLIENGKIVIKTVIKNVHVDFGSQPEVVIKNGITDITRNFYVGYGTRTKVPIKIDGDENNEKRVSLSCFRISYVVFKW